jgi:hypothetical protein
VLVIVLECAEGKGIPEMPVLRKKEFVRRLVKK